MTSPAAPRGDEVAPGIHRIEAPLDGRVNCLYLLVGTVAAFLVDTGLDDTPRATLLPYLDRIGLRPAAIRYVLNTHADVDHMGGNRSLRAVLPDAVFMCHELDRSMIESVEHMVQNRYREFHRDHGLDAEPESVAWFRRVARDTPVDVGLVGGEHLHLGADWRLVVLHTPGHSPGSASVYDQRSRALIVGDAVLGEAVPTARGEPAFPPTYRDVESYLATIGRLQEIGAHLLLTSHYPVLRGQAVAGFLERSRRFAERVDEAVKRELQAAARPVTTRALIERLGTGVGEWPAASAIYLVFALVGHLERLEQQGLVAVARTGPPLAWQWRR